MIENITVSKVKNSAKKEALKVGIVSKGEKYFASIPGGTSRGRHESKDVSYARAKVLVQKIKPSIVGMREDYQKIDAFLRKMDRTKNFSNVGGNLSLGIDIAVARAHTRNDLWKLNGKKHVFPAPLVNVIGGGKHGGNTDFQEFLIVPYKEKSFPAAWSRVKHVWKYIGSELRKKKLLVGSNLENAWITKMDNKETLSFLQSLELEGIKFGIDFAASSLWNGHQYVYKKSGTTRTKEEHFESVKSLIDEFDVFYAEDAFHEEDFESFSRLTKTFPRRLIVGDDLTVTNPDRFAAALRKKSVSGIIVKPNQVGSLVSAQKVVEMAKKHHIHYVLSHRSAETSDNWMGDLCVAWGAKIFKSGIAGMDAPKLVRLNHLWKKIPGAKMAIL